MSKIKFPSSLINFPIHNPIYIMLLDAYCSHGAILHVSHLALNFRWYTSQEPPNLLNTLANNSVRYMFSCILRK